MKKTAIVHIYNFIRMSHTEPSRFLFDDFDTIRRQLILVKQYGFPGTYALKYDALMEPRYQALMKEYLDENDELGAWWEITEPLCRRAGVVFRDSRQALEYDDRVDSAYALGYEPEERKRLVDAYMADFYGVFGYYPASIGSWILDSVTIGYARERYGVRAACICRDQMGVDGFTLWGGWPNGVYFPSRDNAFLPASTEEKQMDIPVFRLLGPDLIYNFEADVRSSILGGVFTLEPAWLLGRDPRFIGGYFSSLTEEDGLGIGYCQIGQENNYLWENIRPGLEPQLNALEELVQAGKVRVETMGASAEWLSRQYRLTPPMSFQASSDWSGGGLAAQWYASVNYRLGLLAEEGRLRIRDLFLYREDYACRYLHGRMRGTKSTFDALPVLWPQVWGGAADRPYIRLVDADGMEPVGEAVFEALDDQTARARLMAGERCLAQLRMDQRGVTVEGGYRLRFDRLPVLRKVRGREVWLEHEGYAYCFTVDRGTIHGLEIAPENGIIRLSFGPQPGEVRRAENVPFPAVRRSAGRPVPPRAPAASPGDAVLPWGEKCYVTLTGRDTGIIRYTLDGTDPARDSAVYDQPICLTDDAVLKACLFTPDGSVSEMGKWTYRFGRKDIRLESATKLDSRPVFSGSGITDLLRTDRGSTDFLDGCWRGSLEDIDVFGELEPGRVESISMGFLSHHRSGIVFPKTVELYTGPDRAHLTLTEIISMPDGPGEREIQRADAVFQVNGPVGAFRIVARRHERMPQWCAYRGTTTVFTMADCLILRPQQTVSCVWEHNGADTILWPVDYPGAFARGASLEEAKAKLEQDLRAWSGWTAQPLPEAVEIEITGEAACALAVSDADSDVLLEEEKAPLERGEYERLRDMALRSAERFRALYESVPDKDRSSNPVRRTFYGPVPRTAREMYEHTKNVNAYYFGEIGVEADNEGDIVECRRRGFEALEKQPDFLKNPTYEGSWDEDWTLRKLLRRFIWHDRIHARAMERMMERTFGI